ncbi:transposase [Enterococcus faecium]|nr:transposase [Enterococcus faecium]
MLTLGVTDPTMIFCGIYKELITHHAIYARSITILIDRLLEFSPPLKEAYPFFHELVEAFRDKDPDLFFSLLAELPETLDDSFREKLQNLLTYEEGITNAMIYPYSNGKIEAKNTHIKTMKRVSYGFKSFENMRIRIFLINQLINVR